MRHIPLIVISLVILAIIFCSQWQTWAHTSKDELIIQKVGLDIENACQSRQIPINDSGALLGKNIKSGFELLTNNRIEILNVSNPKLFLEINPSSVNRGWVITESYKKVYRIYWIIKEDALYYYYPTQVFEINDETIITPDVIRTIRHQSNNYVWIILAEIAELICALVLLIVADNRIFKNQKWQPPNFNRIASDPSYVFPNKSPRDNGSIIIIDIYDDYYGFYNNKSVIRTKTFMQLKNGEFLGYAEFNTSKGKKEYREWLKEFLEKFGKRTRLDDMLDSFFCIDSCMRYQVHFQALLAGYKCFKRNPDEFIKNVRKANSKEELIILCGLF